MSPVDRDPPVPVVPLAHAALIGVPAAYATSGSVLVTIVAALTATAMVTVRTLLIRPKS